MMLLNSGQALTFLLENKKIMVYASAILHFKVQLSCNIVILIF